MYRVKIITVDKVGITYRILEEIAKLKINIKSMEVVPSQIHLKLENLSTQDRLIKKLEQINGVKTVKEVAFLPYERREYRDNAILNAVSEGIIAINEKREITLLNKKAKEILPVDQGEKMGTKVDQILGEDIPMLETLKTGVGYNNQEMMIGDSHYYTSGRPIKNAQERIMGVVATVKDISEIRELYHTVRHPSLVNFDQIIYDSDVMQQTVDLAKKAALTDSTVLLKGETGTGKEIFARAIHSKSPRSEYPFVPVNCAALPDSLLESELFGYEEGAFTGARTEGKQGFFELANKGTIFLDEIGEIPPNVQVKLLRVLQEKKVRRIGSEKKIDVDVRVIAATNQDLEKMLAQKKFREDLYYRLNVIPIYLPPLRAREKDLPLLIEHFLKEFSEKFGTKIKQLSTSARKKLFTHDWPGNIRELRNVLERAVNLAQGKKITVKDLLFEANYSISQNNSEVEVGTDSLQLKEIKPLDELKAELEKKVLTRLQSKYNSSRQMGKVLGVSHTTVLNKLRKYNLS